MSKLIRCSICSARIEIASHSHNAWPINDGRCCERCNTELVIPARLQRGRMSFKITDTCKTVEEWLKRSDKFHLEKPQSSSFHHMEEFFMANDGAKVVEYFAGEPNDEPKLQSFVVEHNWGAVLDDNVGAFILPYPFCSFEFRISGMRCIFIFKNVDERIINFTNFVGCDNAWIPLPTCEVDYDGKIVSIGRMEKLGIEHKLIRPLYEFVFKQIRAICVMFETSVAIKQTIRAPEKLNRQREKLNRTKLRDYHVVVLNRKPRPEPVPIELQAHSDRNSPRLHFRRGHYRHFINHRTWINWQLVGDPDLGFVDKHYRL